MTQTLEKQILVAGIGNAWLRDDGFGGEVVKRAGGRELPAGVSVWTSAPAASTSPTRSCAATTRSCWSTSAARAASPGTLYVMEPDEEEIAAGIEDGEMLDPHGMDPQTVLRFVKAVGGWPGKVVVVACEPAEVEEMGLGPQPRSRRRRRAVELVRDDRRAARRRGLRA